MQVSEEDIQAKCRSDEPNFKHKKYLRSKFEEAMMIEANYTCVPELSVPYMAHNKLEKVNAVPMQPPLPPNPPPPDTPPMLMTLKQEIEDPEYKCVLSDLSIDFNKPEELAAGAVTKTEDKPAEDKPSITMCRNFARGTCKKGPACIFAHELILAQLPGVYTFCRNFQNSVCSFPKCKFVHATVFEKEHFYRTGHLPPHTLAHLKEPAVNAPPPPPPQTEEAPAEQQPSVYCNVQQQPTIACGQQAMTVGYSVEGGMTMQPGAEQADMFRLQDPNAAAQASEWSGMEEVGMGSPSLDQSAAESLLKKCENCPTKELSERLLDAQIEQARRRNQERLEMIAQIDKKANLLKNVLGLLLKTNAPSHTPDLQMPPEVDMSLFNRLQNKEEVPNSNLAPNNNLRAMLAKMLMNMDSGLPPDAS